MVYLAERVLRLRYQYIESILQELQLALGESDWALCRAKLDHCQRMLMSQTAAPREICACGLAQAGGDGLARFNAWMAHDRAVLDIMAALRDAVEANRVYAARQCAQELRSALVPLASEAAELMHQMQAITGDLSATLASVLGRLDSEMG